MDPLSFLKAEIEKKKRKRTENKPSLNNKKWRTRAEIAMDKEKESHPERSSKAEVSSKFPDSIASSSQPHKDLPDKIKQMLPPKHEVIQRLRLRGHPVTMFGETDLLRFERLKKLEASEDLTYSAGQRNDFGRHMGELDKFQDQVDAGDIGHEEREMRDMDPEWKVGDGRKDGDSDEQYIRRFLQRILRDWEQELESVEKEKKQLFEWKRKKTTRKQCYEYIKPFLRKLRKRICDKDITTHITEVVSACEEREYVKAMDWYTRLAIGNAPWPIGVTMVGIHERSGREKISEHMTSSAHILSNEEERKYIQQVKRLMSKCQELYPSTAPSKHLG